MRPELCSGWPSTMPRSTRPAPRAPTPVTASAAAAVAIGSPKTPSFGSTSPPATSGPY
ncbi:hypothetical protein Acr_13g0007120 [Actinidia rufa]|uniref:Uncharacterized protein n=1 Tax=Actinidia rufa TaxID=165716 RepID=A0A7J0FKU1_9ERIC|nr:hypothetical protein Acr_13g0007120 [Actinidia rufa]